MQQSFKTTCFEYDQLSAEFNGFNLPWLDTAVNFAEHEVRYVKAHIIADLKSVSNLLEEKLQEMLVLIEKLKTDQDEKLRDIIDAIDSHVKNIAELKKLIHNYESLSKNNNKAARLNAINLCRKQYST